MKDYRFRFKQFLFKGVFAALLLYCGGSLSAQTAGETLTTLDEVVVTASRTEESLREISSNVTVISEEDIAASTALTLADLVAEHGLLIIETGESSVQIRGYGTLTMNREQENTVLTLVNGRRIGNSNLQLIGLSNVERVEIIRGPSAVQYGSSAMGGVINVITKQGAAVAPYFFTEWGIGSSALHRERLSFGGSAAGFDFALGVGNYGRDDVTISGGRRWYHSGVNRNSSLNADLGYTIAGNHRAGVNFNYGKIKRNLMSNGIRPYENNTPERAYSQPRRTNHNTALSYTGHARDKMFNWSANYSFGNDKGGTDNITKTRTFNAQAGYTAGLVSLSAGVDDLEYNISASNAVMESTGVYFTGKLRLFDERLIFSAGGRHDAYTNDSDAMTRQEKSNFGGSVGAAYLPVNWLKLRVNYAEGFKMPSPRQVGGDSRWYNPNPDLGPEKNKTVEFGADIDWNFIDAGFTYFHSDYDDKIVAINVTGYQYAYLYTNVKAATIAGLESTLRGDLGRAFKHDYNLTPYISFTWLGTRENKDDPSTFFMFNGTPNNTLTNTPEWMVNYGVDYTNLVLKLKTRLSANRYGVLFTRDWSQSPSPWIERPAGTVVNLSAERELARLRDRGDALTLRMEINNLFDGENEMYWGYPGAGRNFFVGLRYSFD